MVAAAIVAACSGNPTPSGTPPSSPIATPAATPPGSSVPPETSAWEQVLDQIGPEGSVSADTALQAFSLAFGPLPEVTVPSGPVGSIRSGSGALRWLVGRWDEITPAQRAEAIRLVPELAGLEGGASSDGQQPRGTLAAFTGGVSAQVRPPTYYAVLAQAMADEIEAQLHLPMNLTLIAQEGRTQRQTSLADTAVLNAKGGYTGTASRCQITFSTAGANLPLGELELTMAHEVWHCYQGQIVGLDWYWFKDMPLWVIEGQAEWVGAAIRPAVVSGLWRPYIRLPGKRLFARAYDAIGFYAHLTQSNINTWDILIPMLQAENNNVARYEASGATTDQFLDTWASSYFRDPSVGTAWEMEGPGLPADPGPARLVLTVANGKATAFTAAAYANQVHSLSSSADVVSFDVRGHARLGDPGNRQEYVLVGGSFCTKAGGCACPPGMSFAGVAPSLLSAETLLAVTGGPVGTRGTATGHALEEFCHKDDAAQTWSVVFWSPDLGDLSPPLLAGYTCDGLESTWKVIFLPGPSPLQKTFELPFEEQPVVHRDFHYDIPASGQSKAQKLDYAIDFELDASADAPVIKVSGTKTESEPGAGSVVLAPREFGSDAPLPLRNVPLETQLKPYPAYQHPFRAQALAECGA